MIDIDSVLNAKSRRLEVIAESLRSAQVCELAADARERTIERLTAAAEALISAVEDLSAIHDGRD